MPRSRSFRVAVASGKRFGSRLETLHEANVAHGVARLVYHVLCESTPRRTLPNIKRAPKPPATTVDAKAC